MVSPTAPVGLRSNSTLHLHSARQLVWSPLRASSDHRFIVRALRAQRPYQLPRYPLLRPRVARAQDIFQSALHSPYRFLVFCFPPHWKGRQGDSNCGRRTSTFQFSIPLFRGVAEAALYCAHRATTASSWGLCEQEGHLAAPCPSSS